MRGSRCTEGAPRRGAWWVVGVVRALARICERGGCAKTGVARRSQSPRVARCRNSHCSRRRRRTPAEPGGRNNFWLLVVVESKVPSLRGAAKGWREVRGASGGQGLRAPGLAQGVSPLDPFSECGGGVVLCGGHGARRVHRDAEPAGALELCELWLGSVNAVDVRGWKLRGVHRVLASRGVGFSFFAGGGGGLLRSPAGGTTSGVFSGDRIRGSLPEEAV